MPTVNSCRNQESYRPFSLYIQKLHRQGVPIYQLRERKGLHDSGKMKLPFSVRFRTSSENWLVCVCSRLFAFVRDTSELGSPHGNTPYATFPRVGRFDGWDQLLQPLRCGAAMAVSICSQPPHLDQAIVTSVRIFGPTAAQVRLASALFAHILF